MRHTAQQAYPDLVIPAPDELSLGGIRRYPKGAHAHVAAIYEGERLVFCAAREAHRRGDIGEEEYTAAFARHELALVRWERDPDGYSAWGRR